MLQEEKKLQELQRCLVERRRNSEPPPAAALPLGRGEPAAPRALGPCSLNELLRDGGRTALCHCLCVRLQLGKADSWVQLHPILILCNSSKPSVSCEVLSSVYLENTLLSPSVPSSKCTPFKKLPTQRYFSADPELNPSCIQLGSPGRSHCPPGPQGDGFSGSG